MDLRRRRVAADIEGVQLRSSWLPLLLGSAPVLRGISRSGDLVGPMGCVPPRRFGPCHARIGPFLTRGWVADATPQQERLIVWDLPVDPDGARDRIGDAVRDAARRLDQHRESCFQWGAAPSGDTASGDLGDTPANLPAVPGSTAPSGGLPTAGTSYDGADPFGRDSKE